MVWHSESIELNGDQWRLGRAPRGTRPEVADWSEVERVDEWLPAVVPGNVRADLVRAGRLSELSWGTQFQASQWVDDHCWWFTRTLSLDLPPGQRVHLILRGVDYISDLFFNGRWLGRHEGMFSPQEHEITDLLQKDNVLAVRILGSQHLPTSRSSLWVRLLNRLEARLGGLPGDFPDRRDTLKCQMGFGWDFAPPLRTMGIWDDAYAVVSGSAWIRAIHSHPELLPDGASLLAEIEIDARASKSGRIEGTLWPETFDGEPLVAERRLQLAPGSNRTSLWWSIPEPRLWWPWDHGRADLYRLKIRLVDEHGQLLDEGTEMLGLRRLEMEGWTLRLNGRPIYARGANWVPASILPGEVREGDYEALLSLAREANMNLLRVWGGGLREKRAFYELCDRMGILVWQEFPLACAFLTRFPRSTGFLKLVDGEARAIVRDLQNHPSLAVWCGGNEFDPGRNKPLVKTLRRVVDEEDPSRPFVPASPVEGDSHYWRVWHNYCSPASYLTDDASFASEFGFQAPPSVQSLRCFLPDQDLWPPGRSWAAHGANLNKLLRYARPFLQPERRAQRRTSGGTSDGTWSHDSNEPSLESFVEASQRAQANGLQIAIEHYRRRKAQGCGGALVWQLNEPWPAISWALVDYGRQPKAAYHAVRRAFQPLLVSLEYPLRCYRAGQELPAQVWLIQDGDQALQGCELELALWDEAGQVAEALHEKVDVDQHMAEPIAHFSWTLPAGDNWRLVCTLRCEGEALSINEYWLGVQDELHPMLRQRLWAWLTSLVVPS